MNKYLKLSEHIAILREIAKEYPYKTIENIIMQMNAIQKEVNNN